MTKRSLSIAAIRSTYTEEKRAKEKRYIWSYLVLRPVSYYVAWLFLRLDVSANKVTVISLIIGGTGCVFLAFGSYSFMIVGALLINLSALLDHVDGNVARYNNSATDSGRLLQDLTGITMGVLIAVSAGIGAFNLASPVLGFNRYIFLILGICGGWAYMLRFFSRFIINQFASIFPQRQSRVIAGLEWGAFSKILYGIEYVVEYMAGLLAPILLLAAVFRFLSIFVLLYVSVYALAFVIAAIRILTRAASIQPGR